MKAVKCYLGDIDATEDTVQVEKMGRESDCKKKQMLAQYKWISDTVFLEINRYLNILLIQYEEQQDKTILKKWN